LQVASDDHFLACRERLSGSVVPDGQYGWGGSIHLFRFLETCELWLGLACELALFRRFGIHSRFIACIGRTPTNFRQYWRAEKGRAVDGRSRKRYAAAESHATAAVQSGLGRSRPASGLPVAAVGDRRAPVPPRSTGQLGT